MIGCGRLRKPFKKGIDLWERPINEQDKFVFYNKQPLLSQRAILVKVKCALKTCTFHK